MLNISEGRRKALWLVLLVAIPMELFLILSSTVLKQFLCLPLLQRFISLVVKIYMKLAIKMEAVKRIQNIVLNIIIPVLFIYTVLVVLLFFF